MQSKFFDSSDLTRVKSAGTELINNISRRFNKEEPPQKPVKPNLFFQPLSSSLKQSASNDDNNFLSKEQNEKLAAAQRPQAETLIPIKGL